MNFQSIRGAIAILIALGLLPAAVGPAAGGGIAVLTVGEAVTQALAAASGPVATVDATTNCIGNNPQPVAYRNDRVVLSTGIGSAAANAAVLTALNDIGFPGVITGTEVISVNDIPGAGTVAPVVSVSFRSLSGARVPIVQLARRLRSPALGSIEASPDYLLSPSGGPNEFWPNGPPKPASVAPTRRAAGIGAGRTIFVYDTGLMSELDGNIPPNVTKLTPSDSEDPDIQAPFGVVELPSAGHTTAIAGVIYTVAPAVTVKAIRITDPNGVATDVSAARRMSSTLRDATMNASWPDLIVNAFGSPACDAVLGQVGLEMGPLGLKMVADAVDLNNHALVVASAGNRSSNRRFYPAAFDSVIGVGGLNATGSDGDPWISRSRSGPKAPFSNWGIWVDAWMPGVGLTTTHVKGYKFDDVGPVINGLAVVDGTSFAAPMAAALIAEQMTATGASAEAAWAAIRSSGVTCSAWMGSGKAVVLTSLAGTATTGPITPVEC